MLDKQTSNPQAAQIVMQFYNSRSANDGITYITGGGIYLASATSEVNAYWTDTYSAAESQSVTAHELGHSLGLDHTNSNTTSCSFTFLMFYATSQRWGQCGVNTPTSDEITGINNEY